MLEVSNVRLPLDVGLPGVDANDRLLSAAATVLGVGRTDVVEAWVVKRNVDARKRNDVHFAMTLGVRLSDQWTEERVLAAAHGRGGMGAISGTRVKRHEPYEPLVIPSLSPVFEVSGEPRPVVVGTGPAGLFAGLFLARAGLRPLVLERGGDVDERIAAVDEFNGGGILDPATNIQFGEGGAGTFSDGKLTTNAKNRLTAHVLHWFVEAGAPEEILWQAKPHIGTDLLTGVVRTIRHRIEEAGGEVRFHTQLSGLHFSDEKLVGIDTLDTGTGSTGYTEVRQLVLACGHSARDTFEAVYDAGVLMEQKPFSVGVRIEHRQEAIDRAQYGRAAGHPALGAADYKLAVHLPGGRSVYTFCMCPGGEVVCAASEKDGVVVNGMSRFARDGENANSALLVGVDPDDFPGDHPLAGVELQRRMEQAAYRIACAAGGEPYQAPAQTVKDFLHGRKGGRSVVVCPSYARGVVWCDLRDCLPPFVADALSEALPLLDRKLRGFADGDVVMTGVETRSSSPVRIRRDGNMQAMVGTVGGSDPVDANISRGSGLYPCGEGAGYAGGIMSAACDGLRVAQAVARGWERRG